MEGSTQRRPSQTQFQVTPIVHEVRELKREWQHLLQKQMERSLNDWEYSRLQVLPEELKELQQLWRETNIEIPEEDLSVPPLAALGIATARRPAI